jgi:hypothetical protein
MPRRLSRIPFADLQRELRRREKSVAVLQRRRSRLEAMLAKIDAQIRRAGGTPSGRPAGGRKRANNTLSLTATLAKVLHGKTLSVTDAAEAARRSGYKTHSKTFRTQVNIALIKSGRFKRVGRGRYTVK